MIHIALKGRLGNNLFQIAAGASLAHAHNDLFCVSVENKLGINTSVRELYEYQKTIFRNVKISDQWSENVNDSWTEANYAYSPIPYRQGMKIIGYFQSEKYFDRQLVRYLFKIDPETYKYIHRKYGYLFDQPITSIHIRRGDYLVNIDIHPICSMAYFRKAIQLIGAQTRFLVVSNDIAWCKRQFEGDNFFFAENETAVVDLYLQSLCTNNIISNSSFSWWGAWLNSNPTKKVVVPDPWFGISMRQVDTHDLIPGDWIKIPNVMPFSLRIVARLRKAKRDLYHAYQSRKNVSQQ